MCSSGEACSHCAAVCRVTAPLGAMRSARLVSGGEAKAGGGVLDNDLAGTVMTFGFDSAVLLATAKSMLDVSASALKRHPDLQVEVVGFADSRGPESYNMKLSERRAEAVRSYLEQAGVLTPVTRELILDRVIALDNELDTEQLKWIVLIVLHSHPGEENAYAWMESLMFDEIVDYIQ